MPILVPCVQLRRPRLSSTLCVYMVSLCVQPVGGGVQVLNMTGREVFPDKTVTV